MLKTFSGRNASQDEYELGELCKLIDKLGLKSYLEIGARHGDTFHHIVSNTGIQRAVAVDLPGGPWGKKNSRNALTRAVVDLTRADPSRNLDFIFLSSQDPTTVELVRRQAPFDLVLIDGDHRYEGVKADWETYGPMARLVAFHDIAGHGVQNAGMAVEVPRLWEEIKALGRPYQEFIAPDSLMGIGVVIGGSPDCLMM